MIGTVTSLIGNATLRSADGVVRALKVGDEVVDGDVIVTAAGSFVEIQAPNDLPIIVPADNEFLINSEVFGEGVGEDEAQLFDESVTDLIAALESGGDLLDALEAPAAGGDGDAGADGGHSFIRLGRLLLDLDETEDETEDQSQDPVDSSAPDDASVQTQTETEPAPEPVPEPEPANQAPIAIDDSGQAGINSSVTVGVANNDSDPDGVIALDSIAITQAPENGVLVVNADGSITYTPNDGYLGPDVFSYTIADDDGAVSNTASVAIQVSDGRQTSAFTDNWVNGVEYYSYATQADYLAGNDPVAAGLTGDRVDENGEPIMGSFSWDDGEFIVFKIGDVIVAEFSAEQLTGDILFIHDIAGLALSNTNADQLENTAIFLQALDADLTDGDLSDGLDTNQVSNFDTAFTNGITISEAVREAFVGYLDPTTGEPLDLQEAGKVMISNALAELGIEFTRESEADPNPDDAGGRRTCTNRSHTNQRVVRC